MHEIIEDTNDELYTLNLIRKKFWLFNVEKGASSYHRLKCQKGPSCPSKLKKYVEVVEKKFDDGHSFSMINQSIFGSTTHELTIFHNNKEHCGHSAPEELEAQFKERMKGVSSFA